MKRPFNNNKIIRLATIFREYGKELYMVGGAARDLLMNKKPHDYDFATNASTAEMHDMFPHTVATGEKHGTITILFAGEPFEVTTYRTEGEYSDGRHPDYVLPARSIEEDLSQRDFTMNAIALDPLKYTIIDPFGGAADITRREIRCVGNAKERFTEDGLRVMRAVRFMAQFGYTLDEGITRAFEAPEVINTLDKISPERIRDEFNKILMTRLSYSACLLMHKYRIMDKVIPELRACDGQKQNEHHVHDVLKHIFYATGEAGNLEAPLHVRLAALLHDIGKPQTAVLKKDGVNYSFLGHEDRSAEMAKVILEHLKYPNDIRDKVVHLVKVHMEPLQYNSQWKKSTIRRFIVRIGAENLDDLFLLNVADLYASGTHDYEMHDELKYRVKEILEEKPALDVKAIAVNGHDLIQIGFREGPALGETLKYLFDAALESPELNTREQLLALAKERL
jgi:poly(A) polymerase/tRNA nucleotidyltransferase (CCA-adding enzyme)